MPHGDVSSSWETRTRLHLNSIVWFLSSVWESRHLGLESLAVMNTGHQASLISVALSMEAAVMVSPDGHIWGTEKWSLWLCRVSMRHGGIHLFLWVLSGHKHKGIFYILQQLRINLERDHIQMLMQYSHLLNMLQRHFLQNRIMGFLFKQSSTINLIYILLKLIYIILP